MGHPTKRILNPFDNTKKKIDCEIVELIRYLWKNNINTIFSCQDQNDDGLAIGIIFHANYVTKFLTIMRNSDNVVLRQLFRRYIKQFDNRNTYHVNSICIESYLSPYRINPDNKVMVLLYIPILVRELVIEELKMYYNKNKQKG